MRALLGLAIVLAVLATGCGKDEIIPDAGHTADAMVLPDSPPPGIDSALDLCVSAAGTADAAAMNTAGGNVTYDRLYAGGVWFTGPIVGEPPMSLSLMFASAPQLTQDQIFTCWALDPACTTAGLYARIDSLTFGAELGDHPVTFTKTDNPAFTVDGTLTIDTFVQPFVNAPGRVAGSITGSMGGRSVSGTFDNEFCGLLLAATI